MKHPVGVDVSKPIYNHMVVDYHELLDPDMQSMAATASVSVALIEHPTASADDREWEARHRIGARRNMYVMAQTRYADVGDGELLALSVVDPEAFGVFYDRFEVEVLAFFWRATRRAEIAADLTAEVFAAALSSVSRFHPEMGSARAWLFGIARHELADAWQRGRVEERARRRIGLEPMVLSDEALERIDELGGSLAGQALRLLEHLPEDQRTAVKGRVLDERSYDELAGSLSCSQGVVRQRVSRGLRSLREQLEQAQ